MSQILDAFERLQENIMGNNSSSSKKRGGRKGSSNGGANGVTDKARKLAKDVGSYVSSSVKNLNDDHPAVTFFDTMCGGNFDDDKRMHGGYSEDNSDDSNTTDEDTVDSYGSRKKGKKSLANESGSLMSQQSDYDSEPPKKNSKKSRRRGDNASYGSTDESFKGQSGNAEASVITDVTSDVGPGQLSKPLASSFAKRCYFTKAGIGKTTQHYEGLTLTGNVVLMLAAAMKLKGCPTICDEDLRRVEQTYPNQFSRLPDELLLSSGWRRISKYCHFSNKPIPDGVPFFHSRERLHPNGGFYFLLAAAVGMVRPIDVEPLTRDTLVLLETDFPNQCDQAPPELIQDAGKWTLVDKFCFFSGGPINTEEDVYYQADFEGNLIFMLAFLSPSLTPDELYKLTTDSDEPGLKSVREVQDVESVYDLTERDFEDLKLYHLGPCRALPPYILQPAAWTKVLPPHFLEARNTAMIKAEEWEKEHGALSPTVMSAEAIASPEPESNVPPAYDYGVNHPQESQQKQQFQDQEQPAQQWESQEPQNGAYGATSTAGFDSPTSMEPEKQRDLVPPPYGSALSSPGGFESSGQGGYAEPQELALSDYAKNGAVGSNLQPSGYTDPSIPISGAEINPPEEDPVTFASTQSITGDGGVERFSFYDPSGPTAQQTSSSFQGEPIVSSFRREAEEEGAFLDNTVPIDEAIAARSTAMSSVNDGGSNAGSHFMETTQGSAVGSSLHSSSPVRVTRLSNHLMLSSETASRMGDPPEDEPPSLSKKEDAPGDAQQMPSQEFTEASPRNDGYYEGPREGSEYGPGRYYRDGHYYDSPEKDPSHSVYQPREEEYYDSPETRDKDGYYRYDREQKSGYYEEQAENYGARLEMDRMKGDLQYDDQGRDDKFEPSAEFHRQTPLTDFGYEVAAGEGMGTRKTEYNGSYPDDGARHSGVGYSIPERSDAGYSIPEQSDTGRSIPEHSEAGYSIPERSDAGYSIPERSDAGYSIPERSDAGYSQADGSLPPYPEPDPSVRGTPNFMSVNGERNLHTPSDVQYSPTGNGAYMGGPGNGADLHIHGDIPGSGFDIISPGSEVSGRTPSDFTPHTQSSAMRNAQDHLRKLRQKRLDMTKRKSTERSIGASHFRESASGPKSPGADSQGTWDSQSEMTSVISGSSVWTDNSNPADRSRRAIILQMAKNRMRSGKKHREDKTKVPIAEESIDNSKEPDEAPTEVPSEAISGIDFSGELD